MHLNILVNLEMDVAAAAAVVMIAVFVVVVFVAAGIVLIAVESVVVVFAVVVIAAAMEVALSGRSRARQSSMGTILLCLRLHLPTIHWHPVR